MAAALGLRYFSPQSGDNLLRNWTKADTVARLAQYIPAVFFGKVLQVSADGKEVQQLNPSRIKFLLPFALIGAAAVYFSMQKIALIAAAVFVVASVVGVVVMGRSEAQAEYNEAYVSSVVAQRKTGERTDKAYLKEEVDRYAAQLANAANVNGWFSGDIAGAVEAFRGQCKQGTEKLVQYLLTADEAVFAAVYKETGNFLMEKMTSREMATAVMAEIVKATPSEDQTAEVYRYQMFVERFARRGEAYSKANWTSEICDAVQSHPVALAGVLTGLAAKEGSIGRAMTRGFTASVLRRVIEHGQLPLNVLGALAIELEAKATDPRFGGYEGLQQPCEARLADAINRLNHAADYDGERQPQTECFMQLKDANVQAKWIQLSLGAGWLKELAECVSLDVAVKGLSGDLASVDAGFLTGVLARLLKEGSKEQAEAVINLANTSTLQQGWTRHYLTDEQIALIQMLSVKHKLDAGNVGYLLETNPAKYAPALLGCSEGMEKQMIWSTFASKNLYPKPSSLDDDTARAFFGFLPGAFKAAVNGISAEYGASIERLVGALKFLSNEGVQPVTSAFVDALDDGQKAILGHYLGSEESPEPTLAQAFHDNLEAWKALGSVGPGTLYNGYIE